jgi:A/G-specific adenine glycosylase
MIIENIFNSEELKIKNIRKIILKWGNKNYKNFPWRKTGNKWHALLAEMLLQRTRVKAVVPVYNVLIEKYPEPVDLANAPLPEVEKVVYTLGLPARAVTLKALAGEVARVEGQIPIYLDEIIKLPGIGSYIASAWLSFHAGKNAVIIDANVVRWICRLVDRQCDAETRRKKWLIELAKKLTPDRRVKDYNYAVLDFTMEICVKKPLCEICPLGAKLCEYGRKKLLR